MNLYDPKCLELAEYFLADVAGATKDELKELAQEFQDAAEASCLRIEDRNSNCLDGGAL